MHLPLPAFLLLSLIALLAAGTASSCQHPVPAQAHGYPDSIGQIITIRCLNDGCHNSQDRASGLSLASWEEAMAGSDWGTMIVPYAPGYSHLFRHINSFSDLGPESLPAMPSADNRLSRSEVLAFHRWIANGARSCTGASFWEAQETRTTGKMVVQCQQSDLMAVVDLNTNRLMRFVEVGTGPFLKAPHYITASPDGRFLYGTLIGGGVFERYRADNYARTDRLEVGRSSQPSIIRLNQAGTRAVVSLFSGDICLLLINTETMEILSSLETYNTCDQAHGIAVSADFRTLWVTAWGGNYVTRVSIAPDGNAFLGSPERISLDANPPQPISTLEPYWAVLSPDESRLFVSCSKTNQIVVLNTLTAQVENRITTGKFPRQFVLDTVGNRLFVACKKEENFVQQGSLEGCISVIRLSPSIAFERNLYRVGQHPHGIGLDYTRNRLRVSSENSNGLDSGHHATTGSAVPGFLHAIDLTTLEVKRAEQLEVASMAASLYIAE